MIESKQTARVEAGDLGNYMSPPLFGQTRTTRSLASLGRAPETRRKQKPHKDYRKMTEGVPPETGIKTKGVATQGFLSKSEGKAARSNGANRAQLSLSW